VLKMWYQPTNLDSSLTGVSGDGSVRKTQIVLNVSVRHAFRSPRSFEQCSLQ
jgi:hypothetical protein